MPRYAFLIEYDGTPFRGWQRQKDQPSVQGAIEAALDRLEPGLEALAAAGRTDTGVHAFGQVAHVDMRKNWDPFRLAEALNYHLKPAPVAIRKAAEVGDGFHARFSAVERRYVYRILNRRAPAVLSADRVWHVQRPLDGAAMAEAARYLLGQHDFTTFRAAECQAASPVKTLDQFDVVTLETAEGPEIQCNVRARSFLHSQVRSFVGTLERVGAGAWTPEDVKAALEAADRARCGPVAPPIGLYLAGVGYEVAPF